MQSETGWSAPPQSSMQELFLVKVMAGAFLSGEPAVPQIVARVSRTLGKRWRWLRPLAQRYVKTIAGRTRPRRREVVKFLLRDPGFQQAWSKHFHEFSVDRVPTKKQKMKPVSTA